MRANYLIHESVFILLILAACSKPAAEPEPQRTPGEEKHPRSKPCGEGTRSFTAPCVCSKECKPGLRCIAGDCVPLVNPAFFTLRSRALVEAIGPPLADVRQWSEGRRGQGTHALSRIRMVF